MFYKKDNPNTEIAYMGCVKGTETLSVLYKNEIFTNITFLDLFKKIQKDFTSIKFSKKSDYYVTESYMSVYDSSSGRYVNCKKFIVNKDVTNWLKLSFSNGNSLICTTDHPLPIYHNADNNRLSIREDSIRTFAQDVQIGDLVASNLKRTYGIKDYSDIFPGHGGVLDRFDSYIFVSTALACLIFISSLF